jgi:hypothetical protein
MDHATHSIGRSSLNRITFSATAHCLTGCSIGEVLGMVIGTALGWGNWATVVVALTFVFGYALTLLPLLRAGIAIDTALRLAFFGYALHHDHGNRRQRRDACHPRCDGCWAYGTAVLGQPHLFACPSGSRRLSGEPLADCPWPGACTGTQTSWSPLIRLRHCRERPLTTRRATSLVLQRPGKRQPEDEQLITRNRLPPSNLSGILPRLFVSASVIDSIGTSTGVQKLSEPLIGKLLRLIMNLI